MPSSDSSSQREPGLSEPQSVERIFESVLSPSEASDERVKLESQYGRDRLKVVLDTQAEIAALREEIELRFSDRAFSSEDIAELKTVVDAVARAEGIEDRINALEGVETVADLRELSVDQLIELEEKHEGVLLYAFTDFVEDSARVDLSRFEEFYKNPSPGTRLRVDFRGHAEAEAKIGAGDVLPPSIRRITVFPSGDEMQARTSTRRIGLKGRNDDTGFFDRAGYIPVYSSDVVIVGGLNEPAKGIDVDFEKKYRTTEGKLDYSKYAQEHQTDDAQFMDGLSPETRRSKYHSGSALSGSERRRLNLKGASNNLEKILEKNPDLYRYARAAREKYATETGVDIPESILFGVIQIESGFNVTILNKQGSGAGGLFQFMPDTWNSFLAHNPWVYEKMAADPQWAKVDQMDWRFNAEIMMYAGYWLATHNMKQLYSKRAQISCREFTESDFYRTGKMSPKDAWLLYLPHHDGIDGAIRLLKYQGLREQGIDARTAERHVGLRSFQKHKHTFSRGKTIYDTKTFIPDQHWQQLRAYAQRNVKWAQRYEPQLKAYEAGL